MNGRRKIGIRATNKGYALVAAMMILLLITALGLLAMITSTSESLITTNLNQDQIIFYYAEQAVDRVLSHLHYLPGGLFGNIDGPGFDPQPTSTNRIDPMQVIDGGGGVGKFIKLIESSGSVAPQPYGTFFVDAWIDPKDFDSSMDRGLSRPFILSVKVRRDTHDVTASIEKAFRIYVKPKSVWDLAYYAGNYAPAVRDSSSVAESCSGNSYTWFGCHSVFLGEDVVRGDVYVSNITYNPSSGFTEPYPDTARLFVRGAPTFSGEVRWRNPESFDIGANLANSLNQTAGGRNTTAMPRPSLGFKSHSKPIKMPPMDVITKRQQGFRQAADLILNYPGDGYAWKIIFRNDLDINQYGNSFRANTPVASAITPAIHPMASPTLNNPAKENPGVLMIYRVPYYSSSATTQKSYWQAAHFGQTMKKRHDYMTDVGGEIWKPTGLSWGNLVQGSAASCNGYRANDGTYDENGGGSGDVAPADVDDIAFNYIVVPSRGMGCPGSSGSSYNGIIFVNGDVLVSGVLDGQVTIAAAGNIILDHEIEYENHPVHVGRITDYANLQEPDMLGLFATGNVIVPNSCPLETPSGVYEGMYLDDWSDPTYTDGTANKFRPTGYNDKSWYNLNDDGNEDIHAVILSYGYQPCTSSGNTYTCTAPSNSDIVQFRTGFYARPRTCVTDRISGEIQDPPYGTSGFDHTGGNSSGLLRIVGSVVQNIPGRVAWDYPSSDANCGNDHSCDRIGFSSVDYFYDRRLENLFPPVPAFASNNYKLPYGYAAYDIISWEEISVNTNFSENLW